MIRIFAHAKVNLYLRVLGQRPDGFHDLETLFERISLADELTVKPAEHRISLHCNDPSLSVGGDNLIMRAAALLQQTKPVKGGATISLVKHIPIASGLGGGSSSEASFQDTSPWRTMIKRIGVCRFVTFLTRNP